MTQQTTEYIFSINPGRSGSHYLHKIFSNVNNCVAKHHPEPVCFGAPMQSFLKGYPNELVQLMPRKIEQIKRDKSENLCYVETNHCFIKGFGWFIPDYFPQSKIGVVEIKRDKEDVLNSFERLNHSPLNPKGRVWNMTPEVSQYVENPPTKMGLSKSFYWFAYAFNRLFYYKGVDIPNNNRPNWLTNYRREIMEWYIEETYRWGDIFKNRFPDIKVFSTHLDKLNDISEVEKMLNFFGLESDREQLRSVVGKKTNNEVTFQGGRQKLRTR